MADTRSRATVRSAVLAGLAFGAFLLASVVVYYPSFDVGFLGDDWVRLQRTRTESFLSLLSPLSLRGRPEIFHYQPLSEMTIKALDSLFGLRPARWHVVSLTLHSLNASLVCAFAAAALRWTKMDAFLTGLLFVVSFQHYEVILWLTCLSYLVTAVFVLAGLICFAEFILQGSKRWLWAYVACVALAVLTTELGVVLVPGAALVHAYLCRDRRAGWLRAALEVAVGQIPAVCVLGGWLFLRAMALTNVEPPHQVTAVKAVATFVYSLFGLLSFNLPALYELAFEHKHAAAAALIPALAAIVILGSPVMRLGLLGFILAFSPNYFFTGFQTRYYYLAGVFMSVFVAATVLRLAPSRRAGHLGLAAVVLLTTISGGSYRADRVAEWRLASEVTTNTLAVLHRTFPDGSPILNGTMLVIDAPARVGHPWGPAFPAHVFQNGLPEAIALSYGGTGQGPRIDFASSGHDAPYIVKASRVLGSDEPARRGEGTVTLTYDVGDPRRVQVGRLGS